MIDLFIFYKHRAILELNIISNISYFELITIVKHRELIYNTNLNFVF